MNFGQALEALKSGKKVARKEWNGKNMFIYAELGSYDHSSVTEEVVNIPTSKELDKQMLLVEGINASLFTQGPVGSTTRLPNIGMRTANGSTLNGWLASQTDMFSEDWVVLD